MASRDPPPWPFETEALPVERSAEDSKEGRSVKDGTEERSVTDGKKEPAPDTLPAAFHSYELLPTGRKRRILIDPTNKVPSFLDSELCVSALDAIHKHLWFAGSKHIPTQLHMQSAMGREIIVADRMDLHLIWDHNSNTIFLKPLPSYLLEPGFWRDNLRCAHDCGCEEPKVAKDGSVRPPPDNTTVATTPPLSCRKGPRQVALGFMYSYVCLVCCESDFHLANEKRLLPRAGEETIKWSQWKKVVREFLQIHDESRIHRRFHRAELRLSRIETINRLSRASPYNSALRGWRSYGNLFQANLTWIATGTVFLALVLTAMQVGLATERLATNKSFQAASYGFTVFSILGPMSAFGLVVLFALFNLLKDSPWLFKDFSLLRKTKQSTPV